MAEGVSEMSLERTRIEIDVGSQQVQAPGGRAVLVRQVCVGCRNPADHLLEVLIQALYRTIFHLGKFNCREAKAVKTYHDRCEV